MILIFLAIAFGILARDDRLLWSEIVIDRYWPLSATDSAQAYARYQPHTRQSFIIFLS